MASVSAHAHTRSTHAHTHMRWGPSQARGSGCGGSSPSLSWPQINDKHSFQLCLLSGRGLIPISTEQQSSSLSGFLLAPGEAMWRGRRQREEAGRLEATLG